MPSRLLRLQPDHIQSSVWGPKGTQARRKDVQAVQDSANADTFERLAAYAFQEHASCSKRQRQRIVPTALAVSGSINPADHADTFPGLLQALRDKVCP